MYNNFEISLVVFMPNITTNHAITYTNNICLLSTFKGFYSCNTETLPGVINLKSGVKVYVKCISSQREANLLNIVNVQ